MNCAIAPFGEFLQLGPLLHMSMGEASAHRTRTNERVRQHLLDWLAEYAPYETPANVHAGIQEEAKALREQVRSFFPISPVLGAHLGIGATGFACISRE
jgi:fatty acid-binding protein DegV